ncbi:hypothetical protein C2E23DRAFT_889863 [Lenzites betulinus]|nr:hypothetical protein C2E23DRAFT_889863 [Lenzites betulinus]
MAAPAARLPRASPFDPAATSTPRPDTHGATEDIPDPRHQWYLRAAAHNNQLEMDAKALNELAQRGQNFVLEYINDVTAMQSRLNRALGDNAQTIRDIHEEMSLGQYPADRGQNYTPVQRPSMTPLGPLIPERPMVTIPTRETPPHMMRTGHGELRRERSEPGIGVGDRRSITTRSPSSLEPPDRVRFAEVPGEFQLSSGVPPLFALPGSGPRRGVEHGMGQSVSTARLNPRYPLPPSAYGLPNSLAPVVNATDVVASVAAGAVMHQDALLVQLCRNIHYKVGTRRPRLPEGVKQPKIENPSKYKGENDHKTFYAWLDEYLSWLRAYNLCGPETDDDRLRLTRMFLTGDAEQWFTHKVDHPAVDYHPTFEEAICAMHRRFVHASSAAKATQDYENVKYTASMGVDGFAAALLECAQMMVVPPVEYDVARRFLRGVPSELYNQLVGQRGLRPEFVSLEVILQHARQVEESMALVRARERDDRSLNAPRRDEKKDERTSGSPRRDDRRRPRESEARPPTRDLPRPNDPVRVATGSNAIERPPRGAGTKTCWACGKTGHFATDPECPDYGKRDRNDRERRPRTRLHAQRVQDDGDEADVSADDEPPPDDYDDWGGSQYASEPDDDDEGSEIERAHALRVVDGETPSMTELPPGEDDFMVRMHAGRLKAATGTVVPMVHSATVRRREEDNSVQPRRDRAAHPTLTALVTINGMQAYTLFDSGSTTDSVSPEFAFVAKAKRVKLDQQVTLQLGCAGSRSKISYGTRVPVSICGVQEDHYFDIVNLDRYDCIVGTPFMNAHGLSLDFGERCIRANGSVFPSFSYEEDRDHRQSRRDRPGAKRVIGVSPPHQE